jgi:anti-sigma factor RsiW
MSRADSRMGEPPDFETGRTLWQRCRGIEAPEDEAERFLDLAALADGMLDEDDHARVAALTAGDPTDLADVAAARALSAGRMAVPSGLEPIIQRAIAIIERPSARSNVVPLRRLPSGRAILQAVGQWGSLAAAVACAGWLGFAMGSGASQSLIEPSSATLISNDNTLSDVLDPSTSFLRDFGAGQQS